MSKDKSQNLIAIFEKLEQTQEEFKYSHYADFIKR